MILPVYIGSGSRNATGTAGFGLPPEKFHNIPYVIYAKTAIDNRPAGMPCAGMSKAEKACPVVTRTHGRGTEVLAFVHPSAGKQFVKGTIEAGETPREAAVRELREENGLTVRSPMTFLGGCGIGTDRLRWHFFACRIPDLPDAWLHSAEDDCGHTFAFFWHPVDVPPDRDWHPVFHEAFAFFAPRLPPP